MDNSNNQEKNKYLIKKVSIMETMRNLPYNKPVEFDAETCGPMSSARTAATRLAQNGSGKWLVESKNNGVTYTITRI